MALRMRRHLRHLALALLYLLATIQFVWCYLWLVRPYVTTALYEEGRERMPFQGRLLMMPIMRWAHGLHWASTLAATMHTSMYWFPRTMQPEVIVQAIVNIVCLLVTGAVATAIYRSASRWRLLTPLVYPLVLVLAVATYVLHTIQNFRFLYDLPSLALFSVGLWLIYFRKPVWWFACLFLVATANRETSLLLLAAFLLSAGATEYGFDWRRAINRRTLAVVVPLAFVWALWQLEVRHIFRANPSEFYPRIGQNIGFLLSPRAWPQMLGACCYLLPVIVLLRSSIRDTQLRAWLWIVLVWFGFMFVYGILIETRVFGELIPYVACVSLLVLEESIAVRLAARITTRRTTAISSASVVQSRVHSRVQSSVQTSAYEQI